MLRSTMAQTNNQPFSRHTDDQLFDELVVHIALPQRQSSLRCHINHRACLKAMATAIAVAIIGIACQSPPVETETEQQAVRTADSNEWSRNKLPAHSELINAVAQATGISTAEISLTNAQAGQPPWTQMYQPGQTTDQSMWGSTTSTDNARYTTTTISDMDGNSANHEIG